MVEYKSIREIDKMRESARIVAECHALIKDLVKPGITTKEIDEKVDSYIRGKGAFPSFYGYKGFPASICASRNEQVVHGIPCDTPLEEGDILSVDIGVYLNGYHGDAAKTYPVGEISAEREELLEATEAALNKALDTVRPGNTLADIARAVWGVAEEKGYGVVREYVGHGIGRNLHEEPQVPNYVSPQMDPIVFRPGLVLAIEPMFNLGTEKVKVLSDNWTVVTADGKASAHFEHNVAVTENGPYVLSVL